MTADGATLLAWDGESKAYLYPLDGGTPKPLPFLNRDNGVPGFSADGRSLYVTKRGEKPLTVWRVDLASGRFERWRELSYIDPAGVTSVYGVRITPDGKSLAYGVFRTMADLYVAEGLK